MKKFFKNNSLSIVFFLIFLFTLVAQIFTGIKEHNEEMVEYGGKAVGLHEYLFTGHFIEATFENWESEFLQMALLVVLTIWLKQKGSSESKDPDKKEAVDREPLQGKEGAPWPVRQGGLILEVYKNSLSIALFALFILSFILHWYGSLKDYNQEELLKGKTVETATEYLGNTKFWFESFQNWQSEFLSVLAMVVLSVFLRQKGSSQSKPVDAPNDETGEE